MIQGYAEDLSSYTVSRPGRVILVFVMLTGLFTAGLGNISTETGTNQFSQGTPAMKALNSVQSEFGPAFSSGGASTQLIKSGQNALSRKSLLDMLELEKRLMDSGIPIDSVSSPADMVAGVLDPNASSYGQKISVLKASTPSDVDRAVKVLSGNPGFSGLVSNDFNRESADASAILGAVSHPFEGSSDPNGGSAELESAEKRMQRYSGDVTVFGQGIVSAEFKSVIFDSLVIVVPAASLLILFFLVYAYRDPVDLVLGVVSLVMAMIWTFGFMGVAGIAFSQMLIAVPPLLLAVGIDFGIHAVNRYKEERVSSGEVEAMDTALRQLLVAFVMVSGTTVIGFLSNMTSSLPPIQDFGLVAGIGITFTTLIFGVFLPAAKLYLDRKRRRFGIPIMGSDPVGSEGSILGRVLPVAARLGRRPYASVMFFLVLGALIGAYGTGVSTSFSQEDFLPPAHVSPALKSLPEPFAPGDYSSKATLNMIDDKFAGQDSVTMYVQAPMRDPSVLQEIRQRSRNVPASFVTKGGRAEYRSIFDVMDSAAARSPRFRALLDRNDVDNDGLPEKNLKNVYDMLFQVAPDSAGQYLSDSYRSTKLVYTVDSLSSQSEISGDAKSFADRFRISATATGMTIVFQGVSDMIFSSAIKALLISMAVSTAFLVLMYYLAFEKPFLAVANMFPVGLTLALILGTMRFLDVPLNALTATILSITIGLGVDYSVHVTHRFEDELESGRELFEALRVTLRGTGGALTSSMLTTVTGISVLVLAITPILGQFGLITGLSIFYSYLSSLIVLPPALVVWHRLRG